MYTTLELLKRLHACKPGYARQLSFFSTKPSLKTQKIPLSAIALIGGKEDAKWVAENALVINKDEFSSFQERTVTAVWFRLLHNVIRSHRLVADMEKPANAHVKPIMARAMTLYKPADILAFVDEHRWNSFTHDLFTEVVRNAAFIKPSGYIDFVLESFSDSCSYDDRVSRLIYAHRNGMSDQIEQIVSDMLEGKKDAVTKITVKGGIDDDDDEDQADEDPEWTTGDEDEQPQAVRRSSPDEGDVIAPRRPRTDNYFESYDEKLTEGQNIANLICDNPFDFITELDFRMPRGLRMTKAENGDVTFTANVKEKRDMFFIIKMMTARSQIPDHIT